jgi:hypothetical protein
MKLIKSHDRPPATRAEIAALEFGAVGWLRAMPVAAHRIVTLRPSGTLESGSGARAASQVVRAEPMSTLDAELNDFGAQLAMLGSHAADRYG